MTSGTGFKSSTIDSRDIWYGDISLFHAGKTVPDEFNFDDLPYVEQGHYPVCGAMAVALVAEWHQKHRDAKEIKFSRPHLYVRANEFYNDPEDKQPGSSIRANMVIARNEGLVLDQNLPMPEDVWKENNLWFAKWANVVGSFNRQKRWKFNYFRVIPNPKELADAIFYKGPLVVGVTGHRGWSDGTPRPSRGFDQASHATVITGRKNAEIFYCQDSLRQRGEDDGRREVHYTSIVEAWGMAVAGSFDPASIQEHREQQAPGNAERYGKPQDFKAEQRAKALLTEGIGRYGSAVMWDLYAKNQRLFTNAVAYGGYNVSYFKLGMWRAGDILNHMHAMSKGLPLPFDLNQPRPVK